MVTMNATILKTRNPLDNLSKTRDPQRFMKAAKSVTTQATRTVCHLWISKLGLTRLACPRMKFAQMKELVAPTASKPTSNVN